MKSSCVLLGLLVAFVLSAGRRALRLGSFSSQVASVISIYGMSSRSHKEGGADAAGKM